MMSKEKIVKSKIKDSGSDKVFGIVNGTLLTLFTLLLLYPIYFILSASISDPMAVNSGQTFLFPKGITFSGYQKLLEFDSIVGGFLNSVLYTVTGVCVQMFTCVTCAFALSRKELPGRRIINAFFMVTMYVGGGLVPSYVLYSNLGMLDTIWVMILPTALNVYNMIVCRSFLMSSISEELFEATKIDGGNYTTFFVRVVLPLSKAILAVLVLYHALYHWNNYTDALYFLSSNEKMPLQIVLKGLSDTFKNASTQGGAAMDNKALIEQMKAEQSVQYAVMVVGSIPVFIMYPFVQKYFVKGVMIGSVKG